MREHKPRMRGLGAHVGIEDCGRFRLQHSVINPELLGRAEAGVGIVGTVPLEVDGTRDVTVAHGGAVGGIAIGIVLGGLARKLLWGAGIHERSFGLAHLVYEGTQDGIIAAYLGVFGYGEVRHHEGSIAFLGHPGIAATIEQALSQGSVEDAAAMLTGSIGMLPSASLNESGQGMYEPCHGSAPDIAGQNIANPLAMMLSVAMMLRYSLNEPAMAERIEALGWDRFTYRPA